MEGQRRLKSDKVQGHVRAQCPQLTGHCSQPFACRAWGLTTRAKSAPVSGLVQKGEFLLLPEGGEGTWGATGSPNRSVHMGPEGLQQSPEEAQMEDF